MNASELRVGIIVRGLVLPEPIEVLVVTPLGDAIKIVGAGQKSGQVHQRVLRLDQLQFLDATPEREPFDGDPERFRLGIEAARLGLAYEYDPYFSLSISRVDPLPHQLEAVYDYFMRLPRIRFLLADDPGAGKTIMAGLLLKELKIRGLVKRTLIVAPANLCFQWQRELKEKFREPFEVVRSDVLRANYGQNPWQEKDQVITSISWISRIEDANDEAHKMAAYSADKKTLAYKLGEALSTMTDHYLLMTATPHKGDPGMLPSRLRVSIGLSPWAIFRRALAALSRASARGTLVALPSPISFALPRHVNRSTDLRAPVSETIK
jgi:hypothetical protein